jgi:hypothetical protein
MLRAAIAQKTETGLKAKATLTRRQLVPDAVVIAIVKDRLGDADCRKGYVLDGFFPARWSRPGRWPASPKSTWVVNIAVEDEAPRQAPVQPVGMPRVRRALPRGDPERANHVYRGRRHADPARRRQNPKRCITDWACTTAQTAP